MTAAYDTYYGMNIESWLDDFEAHAAEFAKDILAELPTWLVTKDQTGQPLTPLTWAREQRQTVEQSEPIQSFLRLVEMYVDEDEDDDEEDAE